MTAYKNMKKITVDNIRKSYLSAPDTDFYKYSLARFFFRPVSFWLSVGLLKLGVTPNQVTFVSWIFALAGCLSFAFGSDSANKIGFLCLIAWALLDYVDGSMARFLNQRTLFGHFIDVVGAYYVIALLPICMAIGVVNYNYYSELVNFYCLVFGAFSSILSTLIRLVLAKGETIFNSDGRDAMNTTSSSFSSFLKWVEATMSPRGIYFPLLLACTVYGIEALFGFIFVYFLYNTTSFVGYLGLYLFGKYRSIG
jgi:phosphatidylglycerophosphate synthase